MRLGLDHPASGAPMSWEAPLPDDLAGLIECLRAEVRVAPGVVT
jgi:23S rRNA pseudouridine1911/1915/1917 synthase